jgi:hypothetical protein
VNFPHVFAKASVVVSELGYPFALRQGTTWFADDPLVKLRPDLFSEDCRYAVGRDQSWTGDPPECMLVPPDDEEPQRGRRRTRPLVSAHGTGAPE